MKHLKFIFFAMMATGLSVVVNAQENGVNVRTKTTQLRDSTRYQCPMKCEGDKVYGKAGKCPVCNMNLKAVKNTATVYQCPMKCEGDNVYSQPGKCPVCNMNLKAQPAKKEKSASKEKEHNHS